MEQSFFSSKRKKKKLFFSQISLIPHKKESWDLCAGSIFQSFPFDEIYIRKRKLSSINAAKMIILIQGGSDRSRQFS